MKSKLPEEWREVKLEEVVDILGDGLHGTPEYNEKGSYYFINGRNLRGNILIDDNTKRVSHVEYIKYKKNLNDRTIFLSINGTIGNIAYYNNEHVVLGKSACYMNIKENINKDYIKYVLMGRSFKNYSDVYSTGTTIKNLGLKTIREFPFNIPQTKEQDAISTTLSSIDNKIELNNKINKNLEQQAQEIFKHWFVDFEFPDKNGNPYKSNGGEMVESELGMIPKRWEVTRLGAIVDNIKEATKPGQHLKNRKYIPIDTMPMESVTIQQSKSYKEAKSSLFLFEEFDILIGAMRVYFHRVNLAPFDGVTRSTAFILRSKDKDDISYNLFLLNLKETIDYAVKTSKGTTMPYAVWGNGLAEKNIANPSQQLKQKFNDIVFPSLERMINNSKENILLSQLRDTLLPKLMSGEIRIPLD